MAHALKASDSPKAFSKILSQGREGRISCGRPGRAWLVVCSLLGFRSFVLEVRSRSGNDVPVNLHQINVIFCSDKKGRGPKAQLSSSEVQVLLRGGRAQVAAPSGPGPRTHTADLTEGARRPGPSWPSGSSGCPDSGVHVPQTASFADGRCH